MLIARVVGTVVSTQKAEALVGQKFLLLRQMTPEGNETGNFVVATDAVGAGVNEVVLYASGSSARQTELTKDKPCDAVVMAIVDAIELDRKLTYNKAEA